MPVKPSGRATGQGGRAIKAVAILGSTGSIGRQALEVVAAYPEELSVSVLAASGRSKQLLRQQAEQFRPQVLVVTDRQAAGDIAGHTQAKVLPGPEGWQEALHTAAIDLVLNAIGGIAGLPFSWATVQAGKPLALANKESLVVAGGLITAAARRKEVPLLPVDSEHSAIYQCLQGREGEAEKLILTASGGPLLDWPPEDLPEVTPAMALQHPNWQMGPRITLDSATMLNKGLEVMEARWLFAVSLEQIQVLIHPESMVHSLVALQDGSMLAQLAAPDMRIPIQYALSWPQRWSNPLPRLDLAQIGSLHFREVPREKFPCFWLALDVARSGESFPVALNAADETAVKYFLQGKIRFSDIGRLLEEVLERHRPVPVSSVEDILEVDRQVRAQCRQLARGL